MGKLFASIKSHSNLIYRLYTSNFN